MTEELVSAHKTQLILTTSTDPKHPASNILDGKDETFWMTTGMFPQELMFQFVRNVSKKVTSEAKEDRDPFLLKSISIKSTNIKKLIIETSVKTQPIQFDSVIEKELDENNGQMQSETFHIDVKSRFLKLKIASGWDNWISIHTLDIEGRDE